MSDQPEATGASAGRIRALDYLEWGIWVGIVTGLLEVVLLAIDRYALGRVIFTGVNAIWMAPAADALLFAGIGGILAIAVRLVPAVPDRLAAFALTLPAFFSLLVFYHPRLHVYSGALLSLGLAVQASRMVTARPAGFGRIVRRSVAALVVLVALVLPAGVFGWQAWQEHRSRAEMGRPAPQAPNVLLIVLDTVRARNLGLYGYARDTTPELGRIARSGARFDLAFAPASWTGPTHGSLFTGHYARELSIGWKRPLDATQPTLAEVLRARGYDTAGFVANTYGCTTERGLARGFTEYHDYPNSWPELVRSAAAVRKIADMLWVRKLTGNYELIARQDAASINRHFLGWLDQRRDGPFFAFLNYFDAHDPYLPPEPFETEFGDRPRRNPWIVKRPWDLKNWTPDDMRAEVDAYDGAIAYMDRQLGALMAELDRRGLATNTLVIVTSDHGEEFREHGRVGHGHSLYRELLNVPLVLRFPGRVPAGADVREPVSLRDVPATILDLIGAGGPPLLPGRSLSARWTGGDVPAGVDPVLSDLDGGAYSLVSGAFHYVRWRDRGEDLFDLHTDLDEQHSLARDAAMQDVMDGFRRQAAQLPPPRGEGRR